MLMSIGLIFILGAVLGGILVIWSAKNDTTLGFQIDSGMFIAYAAYLGTPAVIAIAFYAWKSKAENLVKIAKRTQGLESSSLVETISGTDIEGV